MWRVCSLHLNNVHAKKQRDVRQTLADFLFLMMRDKVDIITGDFNQGAYVLGEVMTRVVAFYQSEHNTIVNWSMPTPHKEIRTIVINWPAFSDAAADIMPAPGGDTTIGDIMPASACGQGRPTTRRGIRRRSHASFSLSPASWQTI